jgi:predicted RNA-binding protein YlxR (DUF448 family)/ribosomal protein L30E
MRLPPSRTAAREEKPTPSRASERTPERTCLACREKRPKAHLVRLVSDPAGRLMVDPQGKLPGRGAYICPQRACAERVVKGPQLQEALRREVALCSAKALVSAMAQTLDARGLACIRIARKAGRVASGYSQVVHALQHEPVALLLVAEDTAPDRLREYKARCASRRIPYRLFLTKARLGALVGRDESSAIGIQEKGLAERLTFYLEGVSRLREP